MTDLFYEAFGSRLSSSIPLPELRPAPTGEPRWRFTVVERLPVANDPVLLGEERIYGSVSARLVRHSAGHRISIDDTGTYDISADLRDIRWQPTDDPWVDFGRAHLTGRVLATALQLEGVLTLHASAVAMADGVVGFLAPKHSGKSTLAMTLLRRGARFVTDDSLAIESRDGIVARPGIQSLRVKDGSEVPRELFDEPVEVVPGRDGKAFLPPFPAAMTMTEPAPVSALYFLRLEDPSRFSEAVSRTRLHGVAATMRLMAETKIGAMLGSGFAPELLRGVSAVASGVATYDLSVVGDLDRLPDVVDRIAAWHGL